MNPLVINLKEDSEYDSVMVKFDDVTFIIKKWMLQSLLEKLTIKGMAIAIEKK